LKNFPALLVSGEVVIENYGALIIKGLAQIGQRIVIDAGAEYADMYVTGGLYITHGGIDGISSSWVSVNVTAGPAIASIQTWPAVDTAKRWGPAGGAFFKSIERK
jgi:hypothetical protein